MGNQNRPPPPGTVWFTIRALRENLRAVDMNADGIYVGYIGSGPNTLGWRRRPGTFDLLPMDIPATGFGTLPTRIADDGAITGESYHPQGVSRPYLWTPTQGCVSVPGLNSTHAPLNASETKNGIRLLVGNHGDRGYVVVDSTITELPLPNRATRSDPKAVRHHEWRDNRGPHRDQVVIGTVTFADSPVPALWYRDEGSPNWRLALTQGRYSMSGTPLRATVGGGTFTVQIADDPQNSIKVVSFHAVGYALVSGRKRAALYWYYRDTETLNGSLLPLLANGQDSVANYQVYNRSFKSFVCGQSGNRAVLWESGHGPGGATSYRPNGETEGFQVTDLNIRARSPAETVLTEAVAMSSTGAILCNGTQRGTPWTFLLEPNSEGRTRLNLG